MEQRSDDLSNDGGLPVPGTDESVGDGSGESDSGPGNVSVDEPTAGALEGDAGTPGGAEGSDESGSDEGEDEEDTSEGTSDDDESA